MPVPLQILDDVEDEDDDSEDVDEDVKLFGMEELFLGFDLMVVPMVDITVSTLAPYGLARCVNCISAAGVLSVKWWAWVR